MCTKCDKNTTLTKQCNECKEVKSLYCFDSAKEIIDKHRGKCKKCRTLIRNIKKNINRSNKDKEYIEYKECSSCKEYKFRDEFYKDETELTGLGKQCKICKKKYSTQINSKKNHNISNKKYKLNNKEKINKHQRERRKKDIVWKLRQSVSALIKNALNISGGSKRGKSMLDVLPYTISELKEHIEKQWLIAGNEWMNWENHGAINYNKKTWQIDHIIPQSLLPYDSLNHPNFQLAWALSNLQPLEAFANIRKSNKIIDETPKISNNKNNPISPTTDFTQIDQLKYA